MLNIKIYAKTELDKEDVLNWMIRRLILNGEISLINLLDQHMDRLTIIDNDCCNYYEVGWNIVDLDEMLLCRNNDHSGLRIPDPKLWFRACYM